MRFVVEPPSGVNATVKPTSAVSRPFSGATVLAAFSVGFAPLTESELESLVATPISVAAGSPAAAFTSSEVATARPRNWICCGAGWPAAAGTCSATSFPTSEGISASASLMSVTRSATVVLVVVALLSTVTGTAPPPSIVDVEMRIARELADHRLRAVALVVVEHQRLTEIGQRRDELKLVARLGIAEEDADLQVQPAGDLERQLAAGLQLQNVLQGARCSRGRMQTAGSGWRTPATGRARSSASRYPRRRSGPGSCRRRRRSGAAPSAARWRRSVRCRR